MRQRKSPLPALRDSAVAAPSDVRLIAGVKNYALVAAIVIVFALGIYLAGGRREILRHLYSHFAILLVVFLIIEYVVLKGRDRSRIYKIERDQARARRRDDQEFLREADDEIGTVTELLRQAQENQARHDATRIAELTERLEALQRRIAQRL